MLDGLLALACNPNPAQAASITLVVKSKGTAGLGQRQVAHRNDQSFHLIYVQCSYCSGHGENEDLFMHDCFLSDVDFLNMAPRPPQFMERTVWLDSACANCPCFMVLGVADALVSRFVYEHPIVSLHLDSQHPSPNVRNPLRVQAAIWLKIITPKVLVFKAQGRHLV